MTAGNQSNKRPSGFLVAFKPVFARLQVFDIVPLSMGRFNIFAQLLKPVLEDVRVPNDLHHGLMSQHSVSHDGIHIGISLVWSLQYPAEQCAILQGRVCAHVCCKSAHAL